MRFRENWFLGASIYGHAGPPLPHPCPSSSLCASFGLHSGIGGPACPPIFAPSAQFSQNLIYQQKKSNLSVKKTLSANRNPFILLIIVISVIYVISVIRVISVISVIRVVSVINVISVICMISVISLIGMISVTREIQVMCVVRVISMIIMISVINVIVMCIICVISMWEVC